MRICMSWLGRPEMSTGDKEDEEEDYEGDVEDDDGDEEPEEEL